MLPNFLNIILRVVGLLISALLLIQPWLIATNNLDPFLYSGWAIIFAAFISLFSSSLLLAFHRPKEGYITQFSSLILIFLAISLSLYFTNYNLCIRFSLIGAGLLACLGSLRLIRKEIDNYRIAAMISLCGFFMAIYSVCQHFGYDFIFWESKFKVVGTLSNPNFLGIFLCMTSAIAFGLVTELYYKSRKSSLGFLAMFLVQIAVVLMLNRLGHLLCLIFMAITFFSCRWLKFSGKISKRTPLVAGILIAAFLMASQWVVYKMTSEYPWEKLTKVPAKYQTVVSRLILWKMGLDIFIDYPCTGAGLGATSHIMPLQKPPKAQLLGLSLYNDDPHSFVVTTLAETGLLGLIGFCTLLASLFGCYIRKNTKYESCCSISIEEPLNNQESPEKTCEKPSEAETKAIEAKADEKPSEVETKAIEAKADEKPSEVETKAIEAKADEKPSKTNAEITKTGTDELNFPWLYTSIAVFILYLAFQSSFIKHSNMPIAISFLLLFFGAGTRQTNKINYVNQNSYLHLSRGTLTAILTFAFYSLFNNSLSILPLTGFALLIASLHYSCCQPDIQWKSRITVVSLLFLFLPVIYGFTASHFQLLHTKEQDLFKKASEALSNGQWLEAEKDFLSTININSQSLKAYYGLAMALDAQQKTGEAQDILTRLDSMVPNIFDTKYQMARILFENSQILDAHRLAIQNLNTSLNPKSYELLSQILLVEGKIAEAEETLKEGLLYAPANASERLATDRMYLSLAAICSNQGKFDDCENYLKAIKTEVAESLDALYLNGMILSRKGKNEQALEVFEKALAHYPHVPRLLNAVGYLLLIMEKDLDRAQILLENAYTILKDDSSTNLADLLMVANSLGKLYLRQNHTNKAEELLKLSYENTPKEWKTLKEERFKDLEEFYSSLAISADNEATQPIKKSN